ncbi:MAG: nitrogenase component 1, partial [Limnohabitans sp.]
MQLTLWTYEGPPHVGAMRVATGLTNVHYVLHAPQGDTYADLLFTMIERRGQRPPVTYTTFQARDLGSDTAEIFKNAVREAHERIAPGAMRVATGLTDVHYVLHAPQGDTYADLLFTMIERRGQRPPVTYTTFQA